MTYAEQRVLRRGPHNSQWAADNQQSKTSQAPSSEVDIGILNFAHSTHPEVAALNNVVHEDGAVSLVRKWSQARHSFCTFPGIAAAVVSALIFITFCAVSGPTVELRRTGRRLAGAPGNEYKSSAPGEGTSSHWCSGYNFSADGDHSSRHSDVSASEGLHEPGKYGRRQSDFFFDPSEGHNAASQYHYGSDHILHLGHERRPTEGASGSSICSQILRPGISYPHLHNQQNLGASLPQSTQPSLGGQTNLPEWLEAGATQESCSANTFSGTFPTIKGQMPCKRTKLGEDSPLCICASPSRTQKRRETTDLNTEDFLSRTLAKAPDSAHFPPMARGTEPWSKNADGPPLAKKAKPESCENNRKRPADASSTLPCPPAETKPMSTAEPLGIDPLSLEIWYDRWCTFDDEEARCHPYAKIPHGKKSVAVRNMSFCWHEISTFIPVYSFPKALADVIRLLHSKLHTRGDVEDLIDSAEGLMRSLVTHANSNSEIAADGRAQAAVSALGLRYLAADALYVFNDMFGLWPAMALWWGIYFEKTDGLVRSVLTHFKPPYKHMNMHCRYVLAALIKQLWLYGKRERPPAKILVALKRALIRTPSRDSAFRAKRWQFLRTIDDLWLTDTRKTQQPRQTLEGIAGVSEGKASASSNGSSSTGTGISTGTTASSISSTARTVSPASDNTVADPHDYAPLWSPATIDALLDAQLCVPEGETGSEQSGDSTPSGGWTNSAVDLWSPCATPADLDELLEELFDAPAASGQHQVASQDTSEPGQQTSSNLLCPQSFSGHVLM